MPFPPEALKFFNSQIELTISVMLRSVTNGSAEYKPDSQSSVKTDDKCGLSVPIRQLQERQFLDFTAANLKFIQ